MKERFTPEEKDEVLNLCDTKDCQIRLSDFDEKDLQYKAIAILLEQDGLLKLNTFKGGAIYGLTEKGCIMIPATSVAYHIIKSIRTSQLTKRRFTL